MQTTRPNREAEADVEAESDTDSLPDRLINPGEYEPVLTTMEEHTAAESAENKEPVKEELRRLIPVYTYGSINWVISDYIARKSLCVFEYCVFLEHDNFIIAFVIQVFIF